MLGSVYRAIDRDLDMRALATLTIEMSLSAKEHDVPQRGVLGFDVKTPFALWCLGGEVWVTGPGLGDRVLTAGESAFVSSPGRVVVQGLAASRVRILES